MTARPIGVEVSCDGPIEGDCPDSAAILAGYGSRTARQVRADGRRDGWTTRRAPGRLLDLCPTCRHTRTRAPEEPTR
ncbi:hypothetical protein IX27_18075 [Streptomyces sp. JS01]|uniref:hypothetical protein n=1 Tax=Streptomyces sp. JS01 TaxID=1525753 RepID=UPI000500CB4D|nr:hypothetical protein [Streptomyces sp. JS01]KFK87804.1 hypothetical protein IX27_18075 [Streptomyces sp. JS01]